MGSHVPISVHLFPLDCLAGVLSSSLPRTAELLVLLGFSSVSRQCLLRNVSASAFPPYVVCPVSLGFLEVLSANPVVVLTVLTASSVLSVQLSAKG